MRLQKPRGTRDFLPDEMERRREIEARMRETVRRFGYREVCTPVFEHLDLFTMKSGEGIIEEMYVFVDKGGRHLTLRPEVTASVVRMFVNEGRNLPKPLRWCYFADCFRYERPQKGRYRQFWQFGIELIGADTAFADAEVVVAADEMLKAAGVTYDLQVGHLAPVKSLIAGLSPDLQRRVMTCLDKRDFGALEESLAGERQGADLVESLTAVAGCRSPDDLFAITGAIPEKDRITEICELLESQKVPYGLNFAIVRGLDYYTGMVFEAFAPNLGAENQILGGGTYRLAHLFGGDDVASCGFAAGFDRIMVSLGEFTTAGRPGAAIVCTPEAGMRGLEVAAAFRAAGIRTETDLMGRSLGAQVTHAAKSADFAVIIGKKECESGLVTLKNLHTGEQRGLALRDAVAEVSGFGDR